MPIERDTLKAVITDIAQVFNSDTFRAQLDATGGDMNKVIGVVFQAQGEVLQKHEVDPMEGLMALKNAAETFQDDPEIVELLESIKAGSKA